MSLQDARRQKTRQRELPLGGRGEAPRAGRSGEASRAASGDARSGTDHLMERVVERGNAQAAVLSHGATGAGVVREMISLSSGHRQMVPDRSWCPSRPACPEEPFSPLAGLRPHVDRDTDNGATSHWAGSCGPCSSTSSYNHRGSFTIQPTCSRHPGSRPRFYNHRGRITIQPTCSGGTRSPRTTRPH